jgi:oxygen-independent coproporphyrinogen-3 oxidase
LSVEPGTPLHRARARGALFLPTEEEEVDKYRAAGEHTAAAGFEHYEISSWALPGRRSGHNSAYWTLEDYRGAGAGAHSFFRHPRPIRRANVRDPETYVRRSREGKPLFVRREELARETLLGEALMTRLRMMDGVDLEWYRRELGCDALAHFGQRLAEPFSRGWLEMRDGRLRLTDEGVLFSNEVFTLLF